MIKEQLLKELWITRHTDFVNNIKEYCADHPLYLNKNNEGLIDIYYSSNVYQVKMNIDGVILDYKLLRELDDDNIKYESQDHIRRKYMADRNTLQLNGVTIKGIKSIKYNV